MAKIPTLIDIIGVQGSRDTGELLSWPLKLDIEQSSIVLNPCLILSSSVSVSSPASLNSQCSPTMSWFEWLIYLVYGKHYHHLMMLWQILLSRPLYIHYKRWDEISYPFLNLNGTTVHARTRSSTCPSVNSTTRFQVFTGGSLTNHRLRFQHPAKDLAALTMQTHRRHLAVWLV